MALYLVTGGAGFIGSHLVAALLAQGQRVRVLDNFSTGRRANLAPYLHQCELVEGDVRSGSVVRDAMKDVDFVLHQAALPSVERSIQDPAGTCEVNLMGTLNVLQAARDARVRRFVYASSSSVYGNGPGLPRHETMHPMPISPYAISKLAGEQYCRAFWQIYGLETVCLRYFNVFGPQQDPISQYAAVIPRFITALVQGDELLIYGDGTQSRDFTFVDNVVSANLLACTAPEAAGKVINIACGESHTIHDLLQILVGITARQPRIRFDRERRGDVRRSYADITQARTILGYQPVVNLSTGLDRTVRWFLEQRPDSAR